MTVTDWQLSISRWSRAFGCSALPAPSDEDVDAIERVLGPLPPDLRRFYAAANGLRTHWVYILPIERADDPKRTWDGLRRANDPGVSRFLEWDRALLQKFLVIADIGAGRCGAIAKEDNSIWYEDDEGFHVTTLDLAGFIEGALRDGAADVPVG